MSDEVARKKYTQALHSQWNKNDTNSVEVCNTIILVNSMDQQWTKGAKNLEFSSWILFAVFEGSVLDRVCSLKHYHALWMN